MRGLRKLKIFGLLPAAAWLLSQAIMFGLLAPATVNAAPTAYGAVGLPLAASAICSTSGIAGQTPADGGDGKPLGECPWCQAFGKAPMASPPNLLPPTPSPVCDLVRHEPEEQRPAGSIRTSHIQSRAPPL